MADDVAIKVSNVSKTFVLPHEKTTSVKSAFLNFYKRKKGYEKQQVLDNVSFEVKKGEFFGIVGRNGSGKSTLLKLISQIYTPDSGDIQVNGKLTPFIELGVGFNPELSGRENVFLNGALLGFNRKEMEAMYDEIVAFAELERFMDQKLKNYSSGMQVRLAFSIAIRANTDILVLDEVLAVGDEAFQRKCEEYFKEVKKKKKTIILVTHSMENVRKYCTKAMMIRGGRIVKIGMPEEIADEYSLDNLNYGNSEKEAEEINNKNKPWVVAKIISKPLLTRKDKLIVEARYRNINKSPTLIKFAPLAYGTASLMTANSKVLASQVTKDTKEHTARYELPLKNFNNGNFNIVVLLADANSGVNIASYGYEGEIVFRVSDSDTKVGGAFINQGTIELIS